MRFVKKTSGILCLLFLGLAIFMGTVIYNQIKTSTFPSIQELSIEDYFVNIGNSVLNGGELEIPDEILTGIISSETNEEIACMISEQNTLMLFIKQELPVIGETDICAQYELQPYKKGDENIIFKYKDSYLGTYKAPNFLYDIIVKDSEQTETLKIKAEVYSIDFMNMQFAVSFDSINIKDGKLYIKFMADTGLKLG